MPFGSPPGGGAALSVDPIRVFLLDDHEVVRRGVRELIENETDMVVTGETGRAEEALTSIDFARPHVALLDVRLRTGSGVEVCRDIRSHHPGVGCLMLTSFADDEALLDSVVAGANGYVLKQVRGTELISNIRAVASGASLLDPATVRQVRQRLRNGPTEDHRLAVLTAGERRILDLLADGLTNLEIAAELGVDEAMVRGAVSTILVKLGMDHPTEAARFTARTSEARTSASARDRT